MEFCTGEDNIYSKDNIIIKPPGLIWVTAPSNHGKSTVATRLILNEEEIFGEKFEKIFIFYKYWQKNYDAIKDKLKDRVKFFKGFESKDIITDLGLAKRTSKSQPSLIFFDDCGKHFSVKKSHNSLHFHMGV
jgi:RNAse (barnase) inhibitor barstar